MPKLATPFVYLAAGVYIRRMADAIQVVTTGDSLAPDVSLDMDNVATKSNWLTEQEVSVEQFNDMVATVSPDSRGALVDVAEEGEEPFLLTQQQAARYAARVESAAAALAVSQAQTAIATP